MKGPQLLALQQRRLTTTLDRELAPLMLGGVPVWFPLGETKTKEPHTVLVIKLLPKEAVPTHDAFDAAAVIEEVGVRLSETEK
jgi:hypothetical protein